MTRLSIIHKTAYKYNKRVTLSYNEARMTPLTDPQQVVLESVHEGLARRRRRSAATATTGAPG